MSFILAFDCSSTTIGWVACDGERVIDRGVIRLDPKADIGKRCLVAKRKIDALLDRYPIDAVAIESPVARFAKAIIPQIRVGAMVFLACAERSIAWCEVAPKEAKKALTEDGAATKREMLEAAAPHFGYDAEALAYRCYKGEWIAELGEDVVFREHEADALGVAMRAAGMVEVVGV